MAVLVAVVARNVLQMVLAPPISLRVILVPKHLKPRRLLSARLEGLVVPTVGHLTRLYGAEMIKGTISVMHVVCGPFIPIRLSAR